MLSDADGLQAQSSEIHQRRVQVGQFVAVAGADPLGYPPNDRCQERFAHEALALASSFDQRGNCLGITCSAFGALLDRGGASGVALDQSGSGHS